MCGRYAISPQMMRRIENALAASFPPVAANPNVAPTMGLPVVRAGGAGYELAKLRWGLVPHWSKEPSTKFSTFNARVESAAEKPAFREAWKRRRCIVPAQAFYEWKEEGGVKIPWRIAPSDGEGFAFAGLWDRWEGGGQALESFAILVGPPNELMASIHDRMPAILRDAALAHWLDPATPPEELPALLTPIPAQMLHLEKLERGALARTGLVGGQTSANTVTPQALPLT